jgi:hypothetical protein
MSKAEKFYSAIINAKLKNPKNAGNVKGELNSLPKDFATLDFPCDITSQLTENPKRKTKVD